jgi:hypothetical protein
MGWEILVIPIIGVAVWIISTLIRGSEDAKRGESAPRKRPEKVTDLDRFLREVQRRREAAEREEQLPRRLEPEEEERVQRRPQPPPGRRPPPDEEAIAVVIPVEAVAVPPPLPAAPVLRTIAAPPLPVWLADPASAPEPRRRESAAPAGLRDLLRSRDGLRTAMILREVLGPPLALRGAPRPPHGRA